MPIVYNLGFSPIWYVADNVGLPLAGGYLATFSSLNHSQFKAVYQDPAGAFPWPYTPILNSSGIPIGTDGIQFDENGSQGEFYFKFDSTSSTDLYYLEVYDNEGVLMWTVDNYTPGTGSGGGGTIIEALNLKNLVTNSAMWRNHGVAQFTPSTHDVLAPGANTGLALTASKAGPDIVFAKNDTSATDIISFPKFNLGDQFTDGNPTPVDYLNYTCSAASSSETIKVVQFPITQGVQNLQDQGTRISIYARGNALNNTLTLRWLQFYGDGSSAASPGSGASYLVTPIDTLTLTGVWQRFTVSAPDSNIPSATGGVVGQCYNDGLFLQIAYPLNATCNIDITLPCVYLGTLLPDVEYETYDMTDGNMDTPRTGDVRTSMNSFYYFGWVPMNDGSIGDASSGATALARNDTFPLFNLIWNLAQPYDSGSTFNPISQMYDSTGVLVNYGASSIIDYSAHNRLQLTHVFGEVLGGTVPITALLNTVYTQTVTGTNSGGNLLLTLTSGANIINNGNPVAFTGSLPAGIVANAVYWITNFNPSTFQFNVAITFANYLAGTVVAYTGDATMTINTFITGSSAGQYAHTMLNSELALASLDVGGQHVYANLTGGPGSDSRVARDATSTVGNTPYSTGSLNPRPFNVMQPTTFMNLFIKL